MELDERYRGYKEGVNVIMEVIIWRIHALFVPLYKKDLHPYNSVSSPSPTQGTGMRRSSDPIIQERI
jgi:hypothetical protein